MIKTDASGDTIWTKTFGGIQVDAGKSVQQTAVDGYIILGFKDQILNYGGGDVWLIKTTPDISDIERNTDLMPLDFSLTQNYPNPFNPSTKISWQLPVGSWQTLKIYDVLGNEVATLVDEYRPAGTYEITWSVDRIPSGVYFYHFSSRKLYPNKEDGFT